MDRMSHLAMIAIATGDRLAHVARLFAEAGMNIMQEPIVYHQAPSYEELEKQMRVLMDMREIEIQPKPVSNRNLFKAQEIRYNKLLKYQNNENKNYKGFKSHIRSNIGFRKSMGERF